MREQRHRQWLHRRVARDAHMVDCQHAAASQWGRARDSHRNGDRCRRTGGVRPLAGDRAPSAAGPPGSRRRHSHRFPARDLARPHSRRPAGVAGVSRQRRLGGGLVDRAARLSGAAELAMALTLRHWIAAALLGCAAVAVAFLPPEIERPPERMSGPRPEPGATRQIGAAIRRDLTNVLFLERRDEALALLRTTRPGAGGRTLLVDPRLPSRRVAGGVAPAVRALAAALD